MRFLIPFSHRNGDDYYGFRSFNRFLQSDEGLKRIAYDHARTIAEANLQAGREISHTLKEGFQAVNEHQKAIHKAILTQTEVIESGFRTVEVKLDALTEITGKGLNEVAGRIDNLGEVFIAGNDRLFLGLSGLKAGLDMGMMNIVTQFELQRNEIRKGFELLADILENARKSEARERYRDGKGSYEQYLRHPDEAQFLLDARDYLEKSVEIYRSHPFAHLYLGHIYQEPSITFDLSLALDHYKLAATYAKVIPNDGLAAVCYFMAGWIAYVLKDYEQALDLGQRAANYDPQGLPENYYNMAKYAACLQKPDKALHYLDISVQRFDPYYTVKADYDADFEWIRDDLDRYFNRIRDEARTWWDLELGKLLGS